MEAPGKSPWPKFRGVCCVYSSEEPLPPALSKTDIEASAHWRGTNSLKDLHQLLSPLVSIPPSLMILMHKQGWQIDEASIEHLLPANKSLVHVRTPEHDQPASQTRTQSSPNGVADSYESEEIYCFNRDHLDADPDELEAELTLTASSILREPPLPEYSAENAESLAQSHFQASESQLASLQSLLFSLTLQRAALGVALSNLDYHLKGKMGGFETFELFASPLMRDYEALLQAYEPSLELIGKIQVHPNLVSSSQPTAAIASTSAASRRQSSEDPTGSAGRTHTRTASSSGSNPAAAPTGQQTRWLADYVNKDKISKVKDQSGSAFNDVQAKFAQLHALLEDVHAGALHLRSEYDSDNLDDLVDCSRDSEEAHVRTMSLVDTVAATDDEEHRADIFAELALLERECRERILYLVARKNAATRTLLLFLQHIATLQSELSQTPLLIREVDSDLKSRFGSFPYLNRLREMAPAYASTLAEVVRRRTYSRHMLSQAGEVANALSKLSDCEINRRKQFSSETAGRLPWTVAGMDLSTEHIELEVRSAQTQQQQQPGKSQQNDACVLPEVTREEAEDFLQVLMKMLQEVNPADLRLGGGDTYRHPLQEATDVLQKHLKQLDHLEADFERFSAAIWQDDASSSSVSIEQQPQKPAQALQIELDQAKAEQQEEVEKLNQQLEQLRTQAGSAQAEAEASAARLQDLEQRHASSEAQHSSLKKTHSRQTNQLHTVQADLTVTASELSRAQAAHASAKATQDQLEQQVKDLSNAKSELEQKAYQDKQALENLTSTNNNLQADLQRTRDESENDARETHARLKASDDAKQSLQVKLSAAEASVSDLLRQVDQLKAANANLTEKERAFHAYKAEAEVDQASLEQQLADLRELQQATASESADNKFLCEQLEAKHAILVQQQKREQSQNRHIPRLLNIAHAFARQAQGAAALLTKSTPNVATNASTVELPPDMPSTLSPDFFLSSTASPEVEQGMCEAVVQSKLQQIEALSKEASDEFPRAINEHLKATNSTLLRWQKECKAYRQRERAKIAFQQFKEGDLALFLPTRNPTAQIWAAFNSGYPHYFLKATDSVAEQIKTREWIVARIVSLEEKTADPTKPDGDPFSLGAGIKFWLLETELWTPTFAKGRKSSGRTKTSKSRQLSQGLSPVATNNNPREPADMPGEPQPRLRSASTAPQTPERKFTAGDAGSQNTKALDLATSSFSVINDSHVNGALCPSPVFTNPDTPPNGPTSNLTEAMNLPFEQQRLPHTSAFAQVPPPTRGGPSLPLHAQPTEPFPPLSSSPQPAFLPTGHNLKSCSSVLENGSISGRSKAGSYIGRRGVAIQFPPKNDSEAAAASEAGESGAFTHASLGSGGGQTKSNSLRKPSQHSRRFSMATTSSNPSSGGGGERGGPKGPSGRGSATLASSFVSSLGRTAGRNQSAVTAGSLESLNKSSPSLDLLKRFSTAVESSTGSPLPLRNQSDR